MDNDDEFKLPPISELKSMALLGLRPVNAESCLKLWDSRMSRAATADKEKMKASNFPISTFIVGNWKRESTHNHKGTLAAKIYYAKKKLVWEFLDGQLKTKMEVSWSDITAIEARMNPDQLGCLRIQLAKPPLFFREIEPQPRKHTVWEKAEDFTNGQALLCRIHSASFPHEELDKHYEKLMLNDAHLAELNRRTFPAHESAYFNAVLPLQNTPQLQQQHPALQLHHNSHHPTTSLNSAIVLPSKRKFDHALQHPHQHQRPLFPSQQNFDLPQQSHRRPTTALFHQSLNSTVTTAARNNGVVALSGNQISNEATLVDSSQQNQLIVPHQLYSSPQQHSKYNERAIPSMKIPSSSVQQNQLRDQYSSPQQHSEHNEMGQMAIPYMNAPSSSVQQNQQLVHQQQYSFHQQHSEIPNSSSHPQHFEIWSSSSHQQHSEIPCSSVQQNQLLVPQQHSEIPSSSIQQNQLLVPQQHSEIPSSSVQQNQLLVPQQHSEIGSSSVQQNQLRDQYSSPQQHSEHNEMGQMAIPYMKAPSSSVQQNQQLVHQQQYSFHQQHSEIPNSSSHQQHSEIPCSSVQQNQFLVPQQHSEIPCCSVQQNQLLVPQQHSEIWSSSSHQQHSEIPSSSVQNGSATGEQSLADPIIMLKNDATWDDATWDDGSVRCYAHSIIGCFCCGIDT